MPLEHGTSDPRAGRTATPNLLNQTPSKQTCFVDKVMVELQKLLPSHCLRGKHLVSLGTSAQPVQITSSCTAGQPKTPGLPDPRTGKTACTARQQANGKRTYAHFKSISLKLLRKNICCLHLGEIEMADGSALNTARATAPLMR